MKDLVEEQLAAFGVPGAAVAVVVDGEVVLCDAFGLADVEEARAATRGTAFAIASTTKAFTAAGVAALVDDGLVEWDTPVRHYLPEFGLRDSAAGERVTPRDLLCHRTGLPRHDVVWYRNPSVDRADYVRRLRHLEPSADLRERFQYSNNNYTVAGYLTEVVSGQLWEEFIRGRLLGPLGMSGSGFTEQEAAAHAPVATPYAERGGELQPVRYAPKSTLCAPAGSIYAPIEDMLRWLRVHLDGGTLDGRTVLSAAALRELMSPQMPMPPSSPFPELVVSAYGMGWATGTYRGERNVQHDGQIDGYSALVSMLPDRRSGVVVLSNRDTTVFRAALGYALLDRALGLDPLPWTERFRALERAAAEAATAASATRVRREDAPPSHPLAEYAGDFEHPAYGTIRVDVIDGGLVPTYREIPLTLTHRHFDVWDLEADLDRVPPWPLTFRTDPDGAIFALEVPFEPAVAPIVFARIGRD